MDLIYKKNKQLPDSRALCDAIVCEAVELKQEIGWKYWKKPIEVDSEKVRAEYADVLHFVIQLGIELGLTPDTILNEYMLKHEINMNRHTNGY